MSDEALKTYLGWVDKCAEEQMSEHEHIWFVRPKSEVVCLDLACIGRLTNAEATAMLNKHAALKWESEVIRRGRYKWYQRCHIALDILDTTQRRQYEEEIDALLEEQDDE